jgi:hypothetical protein
MRRIRLVLALAAVMVVALVATSPAHAVIAIITPGEGLNTAISAPALGGPDTSEAFDATRDAAVLPEKAVGDPQIRPGYGTDTAALKR